MILTTEETQWVTERMKVYKIKYQEVYNEVFDHILTAIEDQRSAGDNRPILSVFQDVVDKHFGGYAGIDELAAGQEKIYSKRIRSAFKAIFNSYFNWKLLVFAVIVIGVSFSLPDNTLVHKVLLAVISFFAISPSIYTFIYVSKVIRFGGKQSLLLQNLISQASLPAILLNGALYIPTLFFVDDNSSSGFKLFKQLPLPVLVVIMILFMLLNLSTITLCNKEMEKKTAH
jgi:hypothetical protein